MLSNEKISNQGSPWGKGDLLGEITSRDSSVIGGSGVSPFPLGTGCGVLITSQEKSFLRLSQEDELFLFM